MGEGKGLHFVAPLTHVGQSYLATSTVPEPGTLALLGTGLCGIAGMVRRKLGRACADLVSRNPRGKGQEQD